MGNISKAFSLFIIVILAVSGLIMIKPSFAQVGVTNPSIPGFSVTLQTYSNYIPPTYGVDPSTGKAVMTKAGYTEIEKWVNVEIGSQPFVRYNNSADQLISLYYDVRWKGNQDTSWQSIPTEAPYQYYEAAFGATEDSQPIVSHISIGFNGINGPVNGDMQLLDPNATQIEFEVEAFIGYYTIDNVFVGHSSGWSSPQTLTISDGSSTANPSMSPSSSSNSTTATQQIVGLDWERIVIIVLSIMVAALIAIALFYRRKSTKQNGRFSSAPLLIY